DVVLVGRVDHADDGAAVPVGAQVLLQPVELSRQFGVVFAVKFGEQDGRGVAFDKVQLLGPFGLGARQVHQLLVEQFGCAWVGFENGGNGGAGFHHVVKVDDSQDGFGGLGHKVERDLGQDG